MGPYGACQADGSEYTGDYISRISSSELKEWHRPRLEVLVRAGVDVLAVETIPAVEEALAILELLREFPETKAWVTFSCKVLLSCLISFQICLDTVLYFSRGRNMPVPDACVTSQDSQYTCHGDEFGAAVLRCYKQGREQLAGVGINCTPPHYISPLLMAAKSALLSSDDTLPRVVYPNSGEEWVAGEG